MISHCLGIRREDKNPWERRTPLVPSHVRELIRRHGLNLFVQPSEIRVFSDQEYVREGALISDSLSDCRIVLAIKEIPISLIEPDKVYLFFSHTIKGQVHNRPMLKQLKDLGCTLIDYERIVDAEERRLLFFGIQAGQAGMIETLAGLGRRLAFEGIGSPLAPLKQPYHYASLVEARESIQKIGWNIHEQGLPPQIVPLVCGFLGYGRTSQGAQEMFDLLPVEEIAPSELMAWMQSKYYSAHKVYKVIFREEHMVEPKVPGQKFDLQEYYRHPDRYASVFPRFLPFLTMLVNCIYWENRFPRFVPISAIGNLYSDTEQPRLRIVGDISCDVNGSIEFTKKITTPDNPTFVYDPLMNTVTDGHRGRGVMVMSIDNLPAEIPLESSIYFSEALRKYIPPLARADFQVGFENCALPEEIRRAVILYKGEFTPAYAYMQDYLS